MNGGILLTKKKKVIILFAIIATLCLLLIGGQTFSKYMTEVRGVGTATVAKWDFKVNGSSEEVQTINLASTADIDSVRNNKIAPGTYGMFEINIDARGADVGINYKVQFLNETNLPPNMIFTYDNKNYNSLSELGEAVEGTIYASEGEKERTILILWEWLYQVGDNETEIAENDRIQTEYAKSNLDYSFDVLVTGTQILPQN